MNHQRHLGPYRCYLLIKADYDLIKNCEFISESFQFDFIFIVNVKYVAK